MATASLTDRIQQIRHRISQAASRSRRQAEAIQLVTVTKNFPASRINEVIKEGCTQLGENRLQEALDKRTDLVAPIGQKLTHHFLGSLQTNKARKVVENFDLIQSVDRPKLAGFLNRIAGEMGTRQDCLIEVKISPEESKMGIPLQEAEAFIHGFSQYRNLNLKGLMTIAPYDVGAEKTRIFFRDFKTFFDQQKSYLSEEPILSMGMTDDFEIAIEEGSNMVRIGRAIFGERNS